MTSKGLTAQNTATKVATKLTNKNKIKFKISIEQDLESNYNFKKLKPSGIKKFHSFIEKIVGKDFEDVEKQYKRQSDKSDTLKKEANNPHSSNQQVIHYGDSTGIRLHGFLREGYFVLIRVDCNHDKHK